MKKLIILLLSAVILLSGCAKSDETTSLDSSSTTTSSSNNSQDDNIHSVIDDDKFVEKFFAVNLVESELEAFKALNTGDDYESYIANNITYFKIDNIEYRIRETKYSDMINNIKDYITDDESQKYLDYNITEPAGRFYIRINLSKATSIIARFINDDIEQPISNYNLYSFTVVHDIYLSDIDDTLITNFKCVLPLTITEEIYKSRLPEGITYDDSWTNLDYIYNNSSGFAIGDIVVRGYSVKASFDREYGRLVHLSYEVNT